MNTLEVVTFDTTVEDDLKFLEYVLSNKDVKLISREANVTGPIEVSKDRIHELWGKGHINECSIIIWNTSISNPLCWQPYLMYYDRDWNSVERNHPESIKSPKNTDEYFSLYNSFVSLPITEKLFLHGKYHPVFSPVIEFDFPDRRNRFTGVSANFSNIITNDVWIVWDPSVGKWKHDTPDINNIHQTEVCQPPKFIEWQESINNWIKEQFREWIIPRFTYRLGSDDDASGRSAQSLANLMSHTIAGYDPQPPVISPRNNIESSEKSTGNTS